MKPLNHACITLAMTSLLTGAVKLAHAESPDIDQVMRFDEVVMAPMNLASSLIGAGVYSAEKELVGKVEDIIFRDDHTIAGLKVGVGGFLGIDETAIAIPIGDVTITAASERVEIDTDLTRDDIDVTARSSR